MKKNPTPQVGEIYFGLVHSNTDGYGWIDTTLKVNPDGCHHDYGVRVLKIIQKNPDHWVLEVRKEGKNDHKGPIYKSTPIVAKFFSHGYVQRAKVDITPGPL